MSDEEESEPDYEIEDFVRKDKVVQYIERKGKDVTAPMVLGRFMMHPSLKEDVDLLIDLTHN